MSPSPSPEGARSEVRVFPKTPRCHACDSGMVAPGIRHSAECKRKRATFDAEESSEVHPSVEHPGVRLRREVETEDMEIEQDPTPVGVGGRSTPTGVDIAQHVPGTSVTSSGVKRDAERSVEDLEAEMEADRMSGTQEPMTIDLFFMDDACHALGPVAWCLEQGPENARATGPELFDVELNSIKFAQGKDHKCVKVKLGGSEVLLWKPDEVIDDSSLMQLDVDLGFEGMKEEIGIWKNAVPER